jgi:hypothetical protein
MSFPGASVTVRSMVEWLPGWLIDQYVGVPRVRHDWSPCLWKKLTSSSASSIAPW